MSAVEIDKAQALSQQYSYNLKKGLSVEGESADAGVSHNDIREAQHLLSTLGYDPGPADGLPDERTRTAVLSMQYDKSLNQTGEITKRLLDTLRKEVNKLKMTSI